MNKKFFLPLAALAVFTVWGCYPGDVSVTELDTVLTLYDEETDFSNFQTFHLPDTIIHIGDDDDEISRVFDQQMLAKVRDNMLDLGYTEVDDIEQSDIVVLLEISRSDLLVAYDPCPGCWCGYWCWYPGWGWYGYDPYYPWGGPVVYSYPVGSVFVTWYDVQNDDMPDVIPAPWAATFNGLIEGSDSQIEARIERGIDQAFDQSPYLAN